MIEQVSLRLNLSHRELVWLFHEHRNTGLDDCLRLLLSCFRKRMSVPNNRRAMASADGARAMCANIAMPFSGGINIHCNAAAAAAPATN